jgi:hypothetical protein
MQGSLSMGKGGEDAVNHGERRAFVQTFCSWMRIFLISDMICELFSQFLPMFGK